MAGRNRAQCHPIEQYCSAGLAGWWYKYLGVSDNLPSRRTRVEHECMTKSLILIFLFWVQREDYERCQRNLLDISYDTSDFSFPSPTAMMRLLSPSHSRSLLIYSRKKISNAHDEQRRKERKKTKKVTHIFPEMTLYSPLRT